MRVWQLLLLMVGLLVAVITVSFPYVDIESKDTRLQFNDITSDPNEPTP
jgi:hypothetical protein